MLKRLILAAAATAALVTPAAAQERQWSLDIGDQDAYLVFGVPESDDVGISLWCTMRSGEISIFVPEANAALKPGRTVHFTITADGKKADVKGRTTANEEAGTTSIEAKLSERNPIFAAMLNADRFKVKVGKEENVFPLIDADVAGLLSDCRKP